MALSPLAVLERGYALVYSNTGHLIKDAEILHAEDDLQIRFARGRAHARVIETKKEPQ